MDKEDIENIIKKNLPEKKEIDKDDYFLEQVDEAEINGFNQALSQINTSLIADEVLKVVVETTKKELEEQINYIKNTSEGTQDWYEGIRVIKSLVLNYLSNLSPNKENK